MSFAETADNALETLLNLVFVVIITMIIYQDLTVQIGNLAGLSSTESTLLNIVLTIVVMVALVRSVDVLTRGPFP